MSVSALALEAKGVVGLVGLLLGLDPSLLLLHGNLDL